MNRRQLVFVVVGLVSVAGMAAEPPKTFQERLRAFKAKADEARGKLSWTREKIYATYPTPELSLDHAEAPVVAPGSSAEIRFRGKLVKGSLVTIDCERVEVKSVKIANNQVRVKVRVSPFELPRSCFLYALAPVTAGRQYVRAMTVRGHVFNLELSNGMTAEVRTTDGYALTSRWSNASGVLGERPISMYIPDDAAARTASAEVKWLDEDRTAAYQATQKHPRLAEWDAAHGALAEVEKRKDADCGAKARLRWEQDACNQKWAAELREPKEHFDALVKFRDRLQRAHPIACNRLELEVDASGRVTGKGVGCAPDGDEVSVAGTMNAPAAKR